MIKSIIASRLRWRRLIVAFAVGGVWHFSKVPLDVVPEFPPVKLIVKAEALGLSSNEVESLITVPIEDLLAGTPWMESITSGPPARFRTKR